MSERHRMPTFIATLIIVGMIKNGFAQTPVPSPGPAANAHVIRVQTGYSCGMCGGLFYHTTVTTVEPSFLVWEVKNSSNPKKLPNKKARVAITRQDWKNLLRSIDVSALRALPPVIAVPVSIFPNRGSSSNTAMAARSD
jgi:hypothetical protein